MTRDYNGRPRRSVDAPGIETLEDRKLLSSFFTGPTPIRPVQTRGGIYTFTINGPGLERIRQVGHGQVAVTLLGTTQASSLDISLTKQLPHKAVTPVRIASIKIISGQLGGITAANGAILEGPVTPIAGAVNTIQFQGLGPNASIDVGGSLGSLGVTGDVNLGPNGKVHVGGSLGQSLTVGGNLNVTGGLFSIDGDLTGSLNAGSINLTQGGRFVVGHDLTGSAQIAGTLSESTNGIFAVRHNLGGLNVGRSVTLDSSSQLAIGPDVPGGQIGDVTGSFSIGEALTVSNNAKIAVGRDVTGTFTVGGDLSLSNNGTVAIGRTLNALTVNGNLTAAPSGGEITVGGNLTNLTVNGAFVGKGRPSTVPDLMVGLNLASLNVLGGGANLGGIQNANIEIGKSLLGLNVPHGIFNSFITAGVSIDGGSNGAAGGNVGPDGVDAIYNSDIRAGLSINHLTIGGDVRSTWAVNPTTSTGYRTRIIAGETRDGNFISGGNIDNFQITGALIDSVVSASVAPNGGNGTLPATGYGTPPSTSTSTPGDVGNNTYDQPAGTITGNTVGTPIKYANYTELSYYNEKLTGVNYNPADPTIDDLILPGSINASFASVALPATSNGTQTNSSSSGTGGNNSGSTTTAPVPALSDPNAVLPLPTKSTVLGGVISTTHGDEADYAGIFAADTKGVFVGTLPS